MRVALVNPPNSVANGEVGANAPPPLGIAYIAAYLRAAGEAVDLFDLSDEVPLDVGELERVNFFAYDVYGFTSYTKTFPALLTVVRTLKSRHPGATVVLGGPHVSPMPIDILRKHKLVDFVISNEGEIAMLQLIRALSGHSPLEAVQNLCFRRGHVGSHEDGNGTALEYTFVQTSVEPVYLPPDDLPFPARDYKIEPIREAFESRRRDTPERIQYMCSSRGCPKRCSFCSIIVMSPKYRARSAESLMRELTILYREQPFGHVQFLDANFFVLPARALEFARALHAWNPSITWSGSATADWICRHADVIRELGDMNCLSLEVGIENGSEVNLKRYNKRTTVDHNVAAVHILEDAGIELDLDFVLFDSETTLADIRANLCFLKELGLLDYFPAEHFFNALKLYPGTEARARFGHQALLAESYLDHELVPPFADSRVELIFSVMSDFASEVQPRIDAQIRQIDSVTRTAHHRLGGAQELRRAIQRAFLRLIRLRMLPATLLTRITTGEHWECGASVAHDIALIYAEIREATERLLFESAHHVAAINGERGLPMNDDDHRMIWCNSEIHVTQGLLEESAGGLLYLVPLWHLPVRLNATGVSAWNAIKKSPNTSAAIERYAELEQCSPDEAADEIASFVEQLRDQGALVCE